MDTTGDGEMTYELFSLGRATHVHGDFYINQVLSGHSTYCNHQARFLQKDPTCFCDTGISTRKHFLYACPIWCFTRRRFFFGDYQIRTLFDRCMDGYSRKAAPPDTWSRPWSPKGKSLYQIPPRSKTAIERNSVSPLHSWHRWWWCINLSDFRLALWICILGVIHLGCNVYYVVMHLCSNNYFMQYCFYAIV